MATAAFAGLGEQDPPKAWRGQSRVEGIGCAKSEPVEMGRHPMAEGSRQRGCDAEPSAGRQPSWSRASPQGRLGDCAETAWPAPGPLPSSGGAQRCICAGMPRGPPGPPLAPLLPTWDPASGAAAVVRVLSAPCPWLQTAAGTQEAADTDTHTHVLKDPPPTKTCSLLAPWC